MSFFGSFIRQVGSSLGRPSLLLPISSMHLPTCTSRHVTPFQARVHHAFGSTFGNGFHATRILRLVPTWTCHALTALPDRFERLFNKDTQWVADVQNAVDTLKNKLQKAHQQLKIAYCPPKSEKTDVPQPTSTAPDGLTGLQKKWETLCAMRKGIHHSFKAAQTHAERIERDQGLSSSTASLKLGELDATLSLSTQLANGLKTNDVSGYIQKIDALIAKVKANQEALNHLSSQFKYVVITSQKSARQHA